MVCKTADYEPSSLNGMSANGLKNKHRMKGLVLNERQMDYLRNKPYLYNCFVDSILENMFLQKFWFAISKYVPKCIAPCAITCVGLLINVITSSILLYYSPDAKQTVPNWAFLVCAIGLFVYQLFDALDGKQAVKFQDTAIEEVYDHGCDAVSALFVTQSVTIATRLGDSPLMQFIFFLVPLIAFYMTHYSCHVTHVMVFGKMDVIEGQWAMIIIHVLTYMFGQQIFSTKLFVDITLTHILFVLTLLALISSIVNNTSLILGADSPMDRFIRIGRKTNKSKWNPMFSAIVLIVFSVIGYQTQVFETNPILFITLFGLCFAKLSLTLQVTNVTNGIMPKLNSCIIGPIFLAINSYLHILSTNTCLWLTVCFALIDHCLYFYRMSIDMKTALDLNIFSLKYPVGHQKCRNRNFGFNLNGTENENAIKNIEKYSQLLNTVYVN